MTQNAEDLGTGSIRKLLLRQAVPASVGILFMTVNILVDTILVGRWIGPLAIAALAVVTPIAFLIASIGLAIGIGGSSVLSRALGGNDREKALSTFAHQIMLTFVLASALATIGLVFQKDLLLLFGAKGEILKPASIYLFPVLIAVPIQALCTVGNSVMRAEDKAKFAMLSVIIPSVANILLDVLLIKILDLGILGAALATAFSFGLCFLFVIWFFLIKSDLRLKLKHFAVNLPLIREISALSLTSFSRQGVIGLLSILLNNTLFTYGGAHAVTVYGIISRMLMFALFPVNGITEGFLPIAGFNYGAEKYKRVRRAIRTAIVYAGGFAILIYAAILIFATQIVSVFTEDQNVISDTSEALRWVFAASPIIAIQLIGAAYFQAAGKPLKALMLTLSKQGFFLIPLILILPNYFGIFGVWVAFPVADILATIVTGLFLKKEMATKLKV
ncbi:MAG: MATE family efflux transporter [Flavobacterium sp.]|nr:MATE family efflux transporter [Flavobacterium sp.]